MSGLVEKWQYWECGLSILRALSGARVDLNALEHFVAAVQAGSLSAAARRTGVPLPTLSRHVRRLEDDLGVRLLERSAQGLHLTEAGARLFADAEHAMALLAQAEQRLHGESGLAATLRVSIPPHFEPMWSRFADFRERFPGARFDVFVTERRIDLAADGIDVVLRVGDAGRASYVGRTLARYRHRVVAAPSLLAGVELTAPEELGKLPCACWRTGGQTSWQLGEQTVSLSPVMATNEYRHLLELALCGRAITELPPFLAHEPLRSGQLVEVLPAFPLPLQSIRVLVADTRLLTPMVRRFVDFLAESVPAALDPFSVG